MRPAMFGLALLMVGALVAGCSSQPAAVRAGCLLRSASPSLRLVPSVSGPLAAGQVDTATAVPAGQLRTYLSRHRVAGAYERVWNGRDRFITDLVIRFRARAGALGFGRLIRRSLHFSPAFVTFTDPGIAGSVGFLLTGRVLESTRFCVGETFAQSTDAYLVTECADYPLDTSEVRALSYQQFQLAASRCPAGVSA